jgi:DNA primase
MAGKISAKDIDEVKSRINIADVISDYVALRPASVGSLKGLCPFHDEKSPSFNVRPAQGFYHCFGCGEGGDVYKFLQQMEQLSFSEAVEKCASKIGFSLSYKEGSANPDQGQRARVLEANAAAAAFYQAQLMTDGAIVGRDFLKGRGFDRAAAEQFGIGFAPKTWSSLFDHLTKLGFTSEELVQAALVTKGDKGTYDKFRGRLIWPIRDSTGQTIGFGARKLFDDDNGPKYLNTSDTLVYHKSQVLYGIDLAKKDIAKKQQVVVVEGYTDVMACHLAGVTTAVATCGTAFGDDHIRILNRMLSAERETPAEVIFTFDPDAAGQKAAMRAFSDSHKFAAATFVAVGPEGLDPCDLRAAKGDMAVQAMIENKKPLFEFAIRQRIAKFDLNTVEGRVGAARAAAPVIAGIRDAALRPAYIRELAGWVSLDGNEISSLVDFAVKQANASAVSGLRVSESTNESSASNQPELQPAESNMAYVNLNDPIARFERQVLEVLIQLPQVYEPSALEKIATVGFSTPAHNVILRSMLLVAGSQNSPDWLNQIATTVQPELLAMVREIAAKELPAIDEAGLARYGQGVIAKALVNSLGLEKAELLAQLRRIDPASDNGESAKIQRALVDLEAQRRKLQSN